MTDHIAPAARPSPAPQLPANHAAIARTAENFEAVFMGEMAKLMLESVDIGDTFSGGHGEEIFRGMLGEKLGSEMARRGGVGLAPAVMEQMLKMQEGSS